MHCLFGELSSLAHQLESCQSARLWSSRLSGFCRYCTGCLPGLIVTHWQEKKCPCWRCFDNEYRFNFTTLTLSPLAPVDSGVVLGNHRRVFLAQSFLLGILQQMHRCPSIFWPSFANRDSNELRISSVSSAAQNLFLLSTETAQELAHGPARHC